MKLRSSIVVAAAAVAFSPLSAQATATTLLSSTFDSQSTSNGASSFSGIAWDVANGLTAQSTLTLSSGATAQRGGLSSNTSRLAVARNIDTAGPWSVDIPVTVNVGQVVTLSELTFDYQFINFQGAAQANAHPGSGIFTLSLIDGANAPSMLGSIGPVGTANASSNVGNVDLVLSNPGTLTTAGNYTLRFTASSSVSVGNNVAVDNFVFLGTVTAVPEPQAWALMLAGLSAVAVAVRRRQL